MTEKHGTAIEWTHGTGYKGETWNPVIGCSKVSAGCRHCYAETLSLRFGWTPKPWEERFAEENVILKPERMDAPRHWRDPRMVFVNSMSDLFHERVPQEYVWACLDVMRECPRHVFQVLTKRPERMRRLVHAWYALSHPLGDAPPVPNIWLGTSIENRKWVGRADVLREVHAAVRFISAEPLLGPLIYDGILKNHGVGPSTDRPQRCWADGGEGPELGLEGIHWLIVGGESGNGHRPMDAQWVRDLKDAAIETGTPCPRCKGQGGRPQMSEFAGGSDEILWCTECQLRGRDGGTAFFFKQWGGRTPKAGGRILDGREWDEMPPTPVAEPVSAGALF